MRITPVGLTIPDVTHHRAAVNGTGLHYVAAGTTGSPILLVHGFPESWWAFHKLIPLLASRHRVYAVDLRGFGDSDAARPDDDSETLAEDLHALIVHLGVGPVHLLVQDVSGTVGFRLAANHPQDVRSLCAVESAIAGFGLELFADVAKGGVWYFGVLATPGTADAFFKDRERQMIGEFVLPFATVVADAVTVDDVSELARGYARAGGWSGAYALYGSALREGDGVRELARTRPLTLPTLAVDHAGSTFTHESFGQVHARQVRAEVLDGVGHYIAMEAPDALAATLLSFVSGLDRAEAA
jgi:pimeloyl-ACP methyl ester carboxylesterase